MNLITIPTSSSGPLEFVQFFIRLALLYQVISFLKQKLLQLFGHGGVQAAASHILVKTEAQCQALIKELETGAEFAQLAKEHSTCPSGKSGGSLGTFYPGQMVGMSRPRHFTQGLMVTLLFLLGACVR